MMSPAGGDTNSNVAHSTITQRSGFESSWVTLGQPHKSCVSQFLQLWGED